MDKEKKALFEFGMAVQKEIEQDLAAKEEASWEECEECINCPECGYPAFYYDEDFGSWSCLHCGHEREEFSGGF